MDTESLFLDNLSGLTQQQAKEELARKFEIDVSALADANLLIARVSQGGYEGDAFILLERDGKLFEVNGGHCSCYGFEGQWDEEPIADPAVLLTRRDYEFEGEDKNNVKLTRDYIAALSKATA